MNTSQKYKNLKLSFTIEDITFQSPSICLERIETPFPMHSHSNDSYEIHYITRGQGVLNTPEQTYDITPNTLFVTGPKIAHEQISAPNDPMEEYCIYLRVQQAEKKKNRKNRLIQTFLDQPFWFGTGNTQLYETANQMISELEQKAPGYELMLQALLPQFLLLLCRLYLAEASPISESSSATSETTSDTAKHHAPFSAKSPAPTERRPAPSAKETRTPFSPTGDPTSLLVEEAFLYHYADLTLDALAAQIGLGNRQTERYLKAHYNKSFQEKKTEARMNAALTMLKEKKNSVSSIALALGYSSVEHFSNAFKRYYKKTPSELRKSLTSRTQSTR